MASGRVERIKEMRNQIPGHRLRYYADAYGLAQEALTTLDERSK